MHRSFNDVGLHRLDRVDSGIRQVNSKVDIVVEKLKFISDHPHDDRRLTPTGKHEDNNEPILSLWMRGDSHSAQLKTLNRELESIKVHNRTLTDEVANLKVPPIESVFESSGSGSEDEGMNVSKRKGIRAKEPRYRDDWRNKPLGNPVDAKYQVRPVGASTVFQTVPCDTPLVSITKQPDADFYGKYVRKDNGEEENGISLRSQPMGPDPFAKETNVSPTPEDHNNYQDENIASARAEGEALSQHYKTNLANCGAGQSQTENNTNPIQNPRWKKPQPSKYYCIPQDRRVLPNEAYYLRDNQLNRQPQPSQLEEAYKGHTEVRIQQEPGLYV